MLPDSVEEVRAILRWAATELASVRSLAAEVGMGHKSLNNFVFGEVVKPRPAGLEQLRGLAGRYRDAWRQATRTAPRSDTDLHVPSFWQGRMFGVRDLLKNAMAAIGDADADVAQLLESGVLLRAGGDSGQATPPGTSGAPAPTVRPPIMPRIGDQPAMAPDELVERQRTHRAAAAAEKERQRQARGTKADETPAAKPARGRRPRRAAGDRS